MLIVWRTRQNSDPGDPGDIWAYIPTGAYYLLILLYTRASGKNKFFPLLAQIVNLGEGK